MNSYDDRPEVTRLFKSLRAQLPTLKELLTKYSGHWGYEVPTYRFYHGSYKVYRLQDQTLEIVAKLQALAPDRTLNKWFMQMVSEGTGKVFEPKHNANWLEVTRPILEAFFHARYFLEMAVKYSAELEAPPLTLPSGWAAFLYLYDLR